ncbi:hypothetical protein QR685DRAFT_434975 [Neurospora intermedia]|uniref:SWIM-type domain-containing protein n=1 Tax=Neurospora intermedia TaxID=5142 RepID=A0ABR3DL22_NEUIN
MCIRVLTIFKCACPHRNTLVCPHHIHVREPSSSTADLQTLSSHPVTIITPTSSSPPSESPAENTTTTSSTDDDDFQKGFTPRLPSALQGHKNWTPLPGKENQRWEHCPGYLAKSRALAVAVAGAGAGAGTSSSGGSGSSSGSGSSKTGEGTGVIVGKETQCAEYKATEPKFRRRWEVKSGLCEECKGMHGMQGPEAEDGEKRKDGVKEREKEPKGTGKGEERGRARSRAATDPTANAVPVPAMVTGGKVVKGVTQTLYSSIWLKFLPKQTLDPPPNAIDAVSNSLIRS